MDSASAIHRFHFAFTITYHYLFPQLTMGLALLIFMLKTRGLREGGEPFNRAARFWARIFGINFIMGVATGIPMEFQFGTNWAAFSKAAGGVIGQLLAMEGVFSFFLESSLIAMFLFGERKLGPRGHWTVALLMFLGTWLSGYFIVAANAWMQHPVGATVDPDGTVRVDGLSSLLVNPWLVWQYLHTMTGSVVTAATAMASVGAFYRLTGRDEAQGRLFVRLGVATAAVASFLMAFPTGDAQGQMVAEHQPVTLAAMEGLFKTERGAPVVLIGQPDMEALRLDNPVEVPGLLAFLTYRRWNAEVKGLDAFPRDLWPQNIPLLYYGYHIMVGLGTLFILVFGLSAALLPRDRLIRLRPALWILMLLLPFPYIANTAGWMTAELGRQPWIIHGLMRTAVAHSANVSAGNALFTLIGFMGVYSVLSMLFLLLMYREIDHGPGKEVERGE